MLRNENRQTEFDKAFEKFAINFTMAGDGYYRCANRFYYTTINQNIVIDYSLKKNTNGIPTRTNEIYNKIRYGDSFLSPYTTWMFISIKKMTMRAFYFRLDKIRRRANGYDLDEQ